MTRSHQRYRPLSLAAALLPLLAMPGHAEPRIHALTGVIDGHAVGGVTIDMVGNLYVGDFDDEVWKITPEGVRRVFATGFYGSSGNVIDNQGNLLQSNYYGDAITRLDRKGQAQPFATSGLSGPVGLAINRQTGEIFVANCRGNSIAKVSADGIVAPFARSDLFNCPNGVALDRKGNLYVVNFRDNKMLKVDPSGAVAAFAMVSSQGLGHLCFKEKGERFYVTAFHTHEIYEVTLQGEVKRILGNGERGMVDGAEAKARLSFPNGIACSAWYPRIYVNEFIGESAGSLPRRSIVREIDLDPPQS
jgi:DNA-binding beta-propeller fold protein YncE